MQLGELFSLIRGPRAQKAEVGGGGGVCAWLPPEGTSEDPAPLKVMRWVKCPGLADGNFCIVFEQAEPLP